MPPTDPLIWRFYDLVMVNGPALKAPIEEEFGDEIISAIDFDMQVPRKSDPKGHQGPSRAIKGARVKIGMSGEFLRRKY